MAYNIKINNVNFEQLSKFLNNIFFLHNKNIKENNHNNKNNC